MNWSSTVSRIRWVDGAAVVALVMAPYFTWDTTEPIASMESFVHMAERRGAINGQLAPIARPDPCR